MKSKKILTYFLLIIIGYFIAKMFSRCGIRSGNNGFSVGGQTCENIPCIGGTTIHEREDAIIPGGYNPIEYCCRQFTNHGHLPNSHQGLTNKICNYEKTSRTC